MAKVFLCIVHIYNSINLNKFLKYLSQKISLRVLHILKYLILTYCIFINNYNYILNLTSIYIIIQPSHNYMRFLDNKLIIRYGLIGTHVIFCFKLIKSEVIFLVK